MYSAEHCRGRNDLWVPGFNATPQTATTRDVLLFFRDLWALNGYEYTDQNHQQKMVLPATPNNPYTVISKKFSTPLPTVVPLKEHHSVITRPNDMRCELIVTSVSYEHTLGLGIQEIDANNVKTQGLQLFDNFTVAERSAYGGTVLDVLYGMRDLLLR